MTSNSFPGTPEELLSLARDENDRDVNELLYLYTGATHQMEGSSRDAVRWWRAAWELARRARRVAGDDYLGSLEGRAFKATIRLYELTEDVPPDAPTIAEINDWALEAAGSHSPDELYEQLRAEIIAANDLDSLRRWRRLKNRLSIVRQLPQNRQSDELRAWVESFDWIP